ncbi:MAG: methyltransferase domain-containing protein [Bacteroidota bacterium]
MENQLTTRQFWLDYWESKQGLVFEIPANYIFLDQIEKIIKQKKYESLLEVGGFPGYFSVWAHQKLNIETTLLDYVVHLKILNQLEVANRIEKGSVKVIETDLFQFSSEKKYDFVTSNGLIEHFIDTKEVIQKHSDLLANGGTLFVTLPNFKSLNGWFQKIFDYDNYQKHNINCMNLSLLTNICQDLGLKEISAKYDGKFMIWLENESQKPWAVRVLKKLIWLPLKIIFKLIPIDTKLFSPYIILTAQRP